MSQGQPHLDCFVARSRLPMLLLLFLIQLPIGCVNPSAPEVNDVSVSLEKRMGFSIANPRPVLPERLRLSEEGAVQIALANNALFHELLIDLGSARADLVQAGLLPNPEGVFSFEAP